MSKQSLILSGIVSGGLAIAMSSGSASASLLIYEPFDYTAGEAIIGQVNPSTSTSWNAAGTAGSTVHSVASPGLTAPSGFPTATGNSANLVTADSTEFARLNLPDAFNPDTSPKYGANSTLYYSALIQVPDLTGLTVANTNLNANNDFIIGFNNTQGAGSRPSNWGGELVIRLGSVAGTYNLGIRASSTPGGTNPGHTYWTPDITANTDAHLIVVRYTQGAVPGTPSDDDSNSLWLDPSSANFGVAENLVPSPDGSSTGSINQNSPTNNYVSSIMIGAGISAGSNPNSLTFDELRVSTTWADVTAVPEPMGLAGVAGLGMLALRRRRA